MPSHRKLLVVTSKFSSSWLMTSGVSARSLYDISLFVSMSDMAGILNA
jgi:hypothetical protein